MGTVTVMVNDKHLFDWEGDEAAVQKVLEEFPRMAEDKGLTPGSLADINVRRLATGSRSSTDPVATMAVMWRILTAKSHDARRPGLIGDYVPNGILAACIDTIGPLSYHLDVAIAEKTIVIRYMGGFDERTPDPQGEFLNWVLDIVEPFGGDPLKAGFADPRERYHHGLKIN
jgi:hypothetical protein